MIQNQHGCKPTKWDRSGVIVEVRDFDKYIVKVDGSGRLTLRNRKYLKKLFSDLELLQRLRKPDTRIRNNTVENNNQQVITQEEKQNEGPQRRKRNQRKVYDAQSGTYVQPTGMWR